MTIETMGAMPTLAVGMFVDVAEHAHGKRGHGTRQDGGRSYDVIFCTDGSEIWFDITTVFASLRRSIKKPDKKPKSD